MSDVLDCPDCAGTGVSKDSLPGLDLSCLLCRGQGKVGGEYGEPAEEPQGPREVDSRHATAAWGQVGWDVPGCQTCAGAGVVLSLGGNVNGGRPTRGGMVPCPSCRPSAAAS